MISTASCHEGAVQLTADATVYPEPVTLRLLSVEGLYRMGPTYALEFYEGAQYTKVDASYVGPPEVARKMRPQRGGGRRQATNPTFTSRQRANMSRFLAKIRTDAPSYFLTLKYPPDFVTYPDHGFPTDPDIYGKHRRNFLRGVRRRHEHAAAVWRLEFQSTTGSPHYHMLVYNLPGDNQLKTLRSQLSEIWIKTIRFAGETSPVRGLHLMSVTNAPGCMTYLAKYEPKQLSSPVIEHHGSSWGKFKKKDLPIGEVQRIKIPASVAHALRRQIRTFLNKTSNKEIKALPPDETLRQVWGSSEKWDRLRQYLLKQH